LAERVWAAAESAAVNRVLIFQQARQDRTPIDPELINKEVQRQRSSAGCRPGFDEGALRLQVESSLRYTRAAEKIAGNIPRPTHQDVLRFYDLYRENFRRPPSIRARHIVKHIDELQTEAQALAGIQVAAAALIAGASFSDVVANHSDCTDNGGDLGTFERGIMVEEFDNVVFSLTPGERSAIFQTAFGYHIAEVTECNADGVADFEDVRGDIERVMIAMTTQEKLLRGLETLRTTSTITRVANQSRATGT
jgi:parvulin-like peptidyl-prolyl isomerase